MTYVASKGSIQPARHVHSISTLSKEALDLQPSTCTCHKVHFYVELFI